MAGLGVPELLIVFAVVMLLFGSTRVPKLARSLGKASKEFRDGAAGAPEPAGADQET